MPEYITKSVHQLKAQVFEATHCKNVPFVHTKGTPHLKHMGRMQSLKARSILIKAEVILIYWYILLLNVLIALLLFTTPQTNLA